MEYSSNLWNQRFLALADHVSAWSKDPSTKVGAVIVRPDRTVVSIGYNGFPRGIEDYHQLLNDREAKLRRTVHAEVNAILTAGEKLNGCTLYVTPLHPCAVCAGIIIQSGIKDIVAKFADKPNPKWTEDFKATTHIFKETKMNVTFITPKIKVK